jgi:hypothetical protein
VNPTGRDKVEAVQDLIEALERHSAIARAVLNSSENGDLASEIARPRSEEIASCAADSRGTIRP